MNMLQNKVFKAAKTAKFAAGGAKLCTAHYTHSSQSQPNPPKGLLGSFFCWPCPEAVAWCKTIDCASTARWSLTLKSSSSTTVECMRHPLSSTRNPPWIMPDTTCCSITSTEMLLGSSNASAHASLLSPSKLVVGWVVLHESSMNNAESVLWRVWKGQCDTVWMPDLHCAHGTTIIIST